MQIDIIYSGINELEKRLDLISKRSMHIDLVMDRCTDVLSFLRTGILLNRTVEYIPVLKASLKKVNYLLKNQVNSFFAYEVNYDGEPYIEFKHYDNDELIADIIKEELNFYQKKLETLITLCNPNYSKIDDIKPRFKLSVPHLGIVLGAIWKSDLIDHNTISKESFIQFFANHFSSLDAIDISSRNLQNKSTMVTEAERDAFHTTFYQVIKRQIENFTTEKTDHPSKKKKSQAKSSKA